MASYKKKVSLLDTPEGVVVKDALIVLEDDPAYITQPGYSSDLEKYPDNSVPFVEKHMSYLVSHPSVNPGMYLSNLRLMTRKR